jgi:UDP-N-acetylmuramyl pentapeptide phosphotransferase/UDP-N-acetylglucosamine-1-phosphate transferase
LGLFVGPALVAGLYDLRERAMLGDTGANLLGALAGLWLVLTLSALGQAVALAVLVLVTVYGELRSISSLIERIPLLRQLDSWGRPQGLSR